MVKFTSARFCKVTNLLSAVAIVFVALYRLISYDDSYVNEAVIALYYIIFALLIVSAEFRLRYIRNLFGFLAGQMGRGFFILLCGTLFLSTRFDITVIIGIAIMVVGALNIGVRIMKGDLLKKEGTYRSPSAQNKQDDTSSKKKAGKNSNPPPETNNEGIPGQGPMIRL